MSQDTQHTNEQTDKAAATPNAPLTKLEQCGYGMGAFTESFSQNSVAQMMLPIFNIMLGVSPGLMGIAAAITRAFDAVSDPVMGYISDNTTSRWGKRKPYILIGGLLSGLFFALIWMVPKGLPENSYFAHFLTFSILYYAATTMYCVPYIGMGCELSDDYNERTKLMSYRMLFVGLSGIVIGWMLRFTQMDCFDDGLQGMKVLGVICGCTFFLFALGPLLLVKHHNPVTKAKVKSKKITIREALGIFCVKPFLLLMTVIGTCTLFGCATGALGTYIVIYYVANGDLKFGSMLTGYCGMVAGTLSIAVIPLVNIMAKKWGKKVTLILFLMLGIGAMSGSWWLYDPNHPMLCIMVSTLGAVSSSSLYLLLFSMMADVCEYDKLKNSFNRTGTFSAVMSWIIKFGIMLGTAVSGYVLEITGFDAKLGSIQSTDTLLSMRQIYATIPSFGFFFGIIALCFYRLNAQKLAEMKDAADEQLAA